MKNIFNINIDDNNEELRTDAEKFVAKRISGEDVKRLDNINRQMTSMLVEEPEPIKTNFVQRLTALLIVAVIMPILIILSVGEFKQKYVTEQPYVIIVLFVLLVLLTGAEIIFTRKASSQKHPKSDDGIYDDDIDDEYAEMQKDLGVPEDAVGINILYCYYKIENGQWTRDGYTTYMTGYYRVFVAESGLCFADSEKVYSFPLSALKRFIKTECDETICVFTDESEAERISSLGFKIEDRVMQAEFCCSLEFSFEGEEFEICIAPYDVDLIKPLIPMELE